MFFPKFLSSRTLCAFPPWRTEGGGASISRVYFCIFFMRCMLSGCFLTGVVLVLVVHTMILH